MLHFDKFIQEVVFIKLIYMNTSILLSEFVKLIINANVYLNVYVAQLPVFVQTELILFLLNIIWVPFSKHIFALSFCALCQLVGVLNGAQKTLTWNKEKKLLDQSVKIYLQKYKYEIIQSYFMTISLNWINVTFFVLQFIKYN